MPIPLAWLIGAGVAAIGGAIATTVFSDDDKSSTKTRSNRDELEEEREEAIRRHNEKIYKEIEAYKEKKLNEIKKDFGVEIQHKLNPMATVVGGIIAAPAIATIATFVDTVFSNDNYEIVFHGIDTSYIEKENENLQNEINELKEFLDEIKNG